MPAASVFDVLRTVVGVTPTAVVSWSCALPAESMDYTALTSVHRTVVRRKHSFHSSADIPGIEAEKSDFSATMGISPSCTFRRCGTQCTQQTHRHRQVRRRERDYARIVIELGDGQIITSTITRGSAERLELTEDDEVVP